MKKLVLLFVALFAFSSIVLAQGSVTGTEHQMQENIVLKVPAPLTIEQQSQLKIVPGRYKGYAAPLDNPGRFGAHVFTLDVSNMATDVLQAKVTWYLGLLDCRGNNVVSTRVIKDEPIIIHIPHRFEDCGRTLVLEAISAGEITGFIKDPRGHFKLKLVRQ